MSKYPQVDAVYTDEVQVRSFDVPQGNLLQPIGSRPTCRNQIPEVELQLEELHSRLPSQSLKYHTPTFTHLASQPIWK
jgi:hypothetical protein